MHKNVNFAKKQKHFSHCGEHCNIAFAQQTALHMMAKEIIEELTGRLCGYCPGGQATVNQIVAKDPERIFTVNIHAQSSLSPTNYPNLNTTKGASLFNTFIESGIPAAVVNPLIPLEVFKIAPAPKKPIPLTTCAAIRPGSALFTIPFGIVEIIIGMEMDTIINIQDPTVTKIWVRNPAERFLRSRSAPIIPPNSIANKIRNINISSY